jgi:site-specific recombinase XerD
MNAHRQSHARAVERINLAVAKYLGTTTHGHRHAYGRRLAKAGVDAQTIQHALHYKSIESQGIYKAPAWSDVNQILREASERLDPENTRVLVRALC